MNFGMPGVLGLSRGCFSGPAAPGIDASLGRGRLRVRRRRLGGGAVGGALGGAGASTLLRVRQGDEVDAASARIFVNSALAPVLLFRKRVKSVADALSVIRQHGFSPSTLCREKP